MASLFDFIRRVRLTSLAEARHQKSLNPSAAVIDVSDERRAALAVERVIRRFYARLKSEQAVFIKSIKGASSPEARALCTSVNINRLIFTYFVQNRGLLDGNTNYLRSKLNESKRRGKNLFYSNFMPLLFFEGFSKKPCERPPTAKRILGRVPYLNDSLFVRHQAEECVEISDAAFEKLFDFLDGYRWRVSEKPPRSETEINADVIGYIFERHVNQKQMGAYYTKDDITEYIGKSTIIPFLFDQARRAIKDNSKFDSAARQTMRDDPDRYIYSSVKKSVETPLPAEIAEGLNDPARQSVWQTPAPEPYALPTETWSEVIARRKRYEELRARVAAGQICGVNDFITFNLDLCRFARDVLLTCDAESLAAFWRAIENISVLDPTCGSGAFLFGAMRILEPLYEACLDRIESFLDEARRKANRSDTAGDEKTLAVFRHALKRAGEYHNRRYFITRSIIERNLFGVDVMQEAVEICKMRLLLKLLAEVESGEQLDSLPDVYLNIRAGNALVGSVAVTGDGASAKGRRHVLKQSEEAKRESDERLAKDYGIDIEDKPAYEKWLASHKPFHWPIEFRGVMSGGGFDVIIGNPPYVSAASAREQYTVSGYKTASCPDVYAWVMERSAALLRHEGRSGMIVPLSLTFSSGFENTRKLIFDEYGANWFSSFARIPSALFSFDVRVRNTIHIGHKSKALSGQRTTRIHRWFEAARPHLFETIEYAAFSPALWQNRIAKLNTQNLSLAFERCFENTRSTLEMSLSQKPTPHALHFKKTAYNWLNFCRNLPPCYDANGESIAHTKFGTVYFADARTKDLSFLLLNGKIMFAFWCIVGDDFDVTHWMFADFPVDLSSIPDETSLRLIKMADELEQAMNENLSFKLNAGKRVGNYNLAKCREVTDKSDTIFAQLLGIESAWPDIELLYSQVVKTDFNADAQ